MTSVARPRPASASGSRVASAARALLAVLLVLIPLCFTQWTLEAFELLKVSLLHVGALGLLALGASALLLRPSGGVSLLARVRGWAGEVAREPLALGFVLLLLSGLVSTVTSLSRWTSLVGAHESYSGLPTVLAYGVLFFATRAVCRSGAQARVLLAAPVLASALVAGYAWAQWLDVDALRWERVATLGERARIFSTLGHPSHLAAWLAMALPLVALFALRARAAGQRAVLVRLGALAAAGLGAAVLTFSRGGWLALLAALGVLGLGHSRHLSRRAVALGALGLGLLAVVLGVGLWLAPEDGGALAALRGRLLHFGEGSTRLHIWRAALGMFTEHPLWGTGLDTFQLAFEGKRSAEYWQLEWNGTPAKAHNAPLHMLATQGALGGLALLVVCGGAGLALRRAGRRLGAEERPLLVVVAAGLLAFGVQDLFSFGVAATGSLAVVLCGVLSGLGREGGSEVALSAPRKAERWALGLAGALGCAVFLAGLWGPGAQRGGAGAMLGLLLPCLALVGTARGVLRVGLGGGHPHPGPLPKGEGTDTGSTRLRPSGWRRVGMVAVWAGALALAAWGVGRPVLASAACRDGQAWLVLSPEKALPFLERSVALDPTRDVCLARLGTAALLVAKTTTDGGVRRAALEQAGRAFERARALVPADAYHRSNLARLRTELARDGKARADEAFAAYDAALALDPANGHILADAALSALTLGDTGRARVYAARALSLYADFAPPRAVLGYLALAAGDAEGAVRLLEGAMKGHWRGDEGARRAALGNLAAALLRLGRHAEALEPAREAVRLMPDNVDTRFNLGRTLQLLGRHAEAAEEFRRILARQPTHAPAREALQASTTSP